MKRRLLLPVLFLFAILGGSFLSADDSLTLDQTRTLAVAHSKTLQKLLLSVDSALVDEKIQSFTRLPSITATAGANAAVPQPSVLNALGVSAGVTVAQTVYDGGRSTILSAIDSLSTSIAREKARAQYLGVQAAADAAFFTAVTAAASVDAAQSDLDDARANQALAQARMETGTLARSELLKAEAETAAKETALVQAQGRRSVSERTLASLIGLSLPLKLESFESAADEGLVRRFASLTEPQIDALATNLRGAAEKYSPTIVQASLASRQARSAVDLAKAGTLPSLNASWSSSVGLAGGNGTWSSALSLGLSLPLDVWTTQANVDSKMLAVRQADLDQEESKRTLELEIEASVFDIISAARAVLSSQKALDYAQSHSQSVQERYRLSSASLSDLSDAELLVSTNRTALITARSQFLTGISSLRTLAGLETDDLLIAIIP